MLSKQWSPSNSGAKQSLPIPWCCNLSGRTLDDCISVFPCLFSSPLFFLPIKRLRTHLCEISPLPEKMAPGHRVDMASSFSIAKQRILLNKKISSDGPGRGGDRFPSTLIEKRESGCPLIFFSFFFFLFYDFSLIIVSCDLFFAGSLSFLARKYFPSQILPLCSMRKICTFTAGGRYQEKAKVKS